MIRFLLVFASLIVLASCADPDRYGDPLDHSPDEEGYYYQLITVPIPEDIVLEVGGLEILNDGRPAVATRRGEVWFIDGAYGSQSSPDYHLFAQGLHEPLGLLEKDGALYTAQRGELTRLVDEDGDERADVFETVYAWPLTGNYHEYSYGPLELPNGHLFVSLNLAWVGHGASPARWRGWALEISPEGEAMPIAAGFRSPAGIAVTSNGDLFYGENQGDWIGSGWITHIEKGDFLGHPAGLAWTDDEKSPLSLTADQIPNTGAPMHVAAKTIPEMKLPAVWFPHTIMGISTSAIIEDGTGGDFGPFAGQLFVGDQGHSKLMRVYLEKVNGNYQGANFPFYEGFSSGILRTAWGEDHSLFVGQTSRGWDATGKEPYALERLLWTGNVPFEMKEIQAKHDGFNIVFTLPVDAEQASDAAMYEVTNFTYKYHNTYGSPAVDITPLRVDDAAVSDDGYEVRLRVSGLREGYIHEIRLGDMVSAEGAPLLHDMAFYTLNALPNDASGSAPEAGAAASGDGGGEAPDRAAKRTAEMPAEWNGQVDHTLELATLPGLRFDQESFDVQPGSKVRLHFNNDDDMLHNLVITVPGKADEVAEQAMNLGLRGQEMAYVPEVEAVLYHTSLLQPETEESIYFVAPDEPGEYPFVCTFPGHAMTMRGVLHVR